MDKTAQASGITISRSLFAFSIFYGGMVCIAGVLGNKQVALGPLIVSLLLTLAVLAVPASPEMAPERLTAFELMMNGTPRIWIGGIIAYGISQTLNVSIFSWLKGREGAQLLWLRSAIAGMLSQAVDSLLFVAVAFYGVFPIGQLLLGQIIAKVALSAILVPPLIYVFVALGRKLDGTPTPA